MNKHSNSLRHHAHRTAAALLAVAVVAGSCAGAAGRVHREGEGPLAVQVGSGGVAIHVPDHVPWYASFGGFLPCVTVPGTIAVLDQVELIEATTARPVDVSVLYRTGFTDADMVFASAIGLPPDVDHGTVEGDLQTDFAGTRIDLDCEQARESGVELSEIIVVIRANTRGADLDGLRVHYHMVDNPDRTYTLEVDWQMTACGTSIEDPDLCPDSDDHGSTDGMGAPARYLT